MKFNKKFITCALSFFYSACFSTVSFADGLVVDKIYHPYVDAIETEIEYRAILQDQHPSINNYSQLHLFSIGTAINENFFGEVYIIAAKSRNGDFEVEAYEAELKWQLTEQGEYSADWGLIFEFENEIDADIKEVAVGILSEKEWGRWSGTANLFLIEEWGDDINSEFETIFSAQARYRYSSLFEPALELYLGQDTKGIGPAVQGTINAGIRKNLHWEAGLVLGIDHKSPDQTFRFLMEYEF